MIQQIGLMETRVVLEMSCSNTLPQEHYFPKCINMSSGWSIQQKNESWSDNGTGKSDKAVHYRMSTKIFNTIYRHQNPMS